MTRDPPTYAALLTPLAPGAIAVIALAGPRTDDILSTILRKPRRLEPVALILARPTYCRILDGESFLDDAVAVRLDGPRAELCTHGGVRIAQRLLQLMERLGALIVPAQQFNDAVAPIHPIERDIDAALLNSPSRKLTHWLLSQRTILPPFIDHLGTLSAAERDAFTARSRAAIRLFEGLSIALIGPPNAGKSTLANRLIGRDRVITSDVPGTTRDWVAETALIDGWPVTLTDTAGIRETDCAIETEAIHRGRQQAHRADLVLIVVDATTPPAEQAARLEHLINMLPPKISRIVVVNKCDLAGNDQSRTCKEAPGDAPNAIPGRATTGLTLRISALTGHGIDDLETQITAQFGLDQLTDELPTGLHKAHVDR